VLQGLPVAMLEQDADRVSRLDQPGVAAFAWSTSAGATRVLENVINRVPGFGPSALSYPIYDPGFVNVLTGEQSFLANQPGELRRFCSTGREGFWMPDGCGMPMAYSA
jgi:hypothetical protein